MLGTVMLDCRREGHKISREARTRQETHIEQKGKQTAANMSVRDPLVMAIYRPDRRDSPAISLVEIGATWRSKMDAFWTQKNDTVAQELVASPRSAKVTC